jgi:hypothetical protein
MAFPSIAGTQKSVESASVTAHDATLPASVAADDILIVWIFQDGASGGFTWPAGWTEVLDSAVVSTEASVTVGWRRATGGETTVQVTSVNAERSTHIAVRITGAHTTTAPEFSATATGTSANPNPDSLNPTNWDIEDTLWIAWQVNDLQATTVFPYANNNVSTSSTDVTSASYGAICSTDSAAASVDPGTFTIGASDQWRAGTVAIRPVGSSTTTFTPAAVAFDFNPVAGTFGLSLAFAPAAVAMSLDEVAPTIATPLSLTPAAVAFDFNPVAPLFVFDWLFAPAPVVFDFNPVVPVIATSLDLTPPAVPMSLDEVVPVLGLVNTFAPAAVPFDFNPVAPLLDTPLTLTPPPVAFDFNPVQPVLVLTLAFTPSPVVAILGVATPTLDVGSSTITFAPSPVVLVLSLVAPAFERVEPTIAFAGDALDTSPRVRFYWYRGLRHKAVQAGRKF